MAVEAAGVGTGIVPPAVIEAEDTPLVVTLGSGNDLKIVSNAINQGSVDERLSFYFIC